jgi:uncharacterized protein YndB with AHSA1/START domain
MNPIFEINRAVGEMVVTVTFPVLKKFVWAAFTRSEELDRWWAPSPWRCETTSMDFKPGGHWHYGMCGPEGERSYGMQHYVEIVEGESFAGSDEFCDDAGVTSPDFLPAAFTITFREIDSGTEVIMHTTFASPEEMQKTIDMGVAPGLTMALKQLHDHLTQ